MYLNNMAKQSLFAKRMGVQLDPVKPPPPGPFQCREIKEIPLEDRPSSDKPKYPCESTGLPLVFALDENDLKEETKKYPVADLPDIHQENLMKIQQMNPKELDSAYAEINNLLSPEAIQMLKQRGKQQHTTKAEKIQPNIELNAHSETCFQHNVFPTEVPEKWKYDIEGRVVQEFAENEWKNPERQGLGLSEALRMTRSAISSQRAIAFRTLLNILIQEEAVKFKENLKYLEDNELSKCVCFGLGDPNGSAVIEAFDLLYSISTKELHRHMKIQDKWDLISPMLENPKENGLVPENIRKKASYWEEEECRSFIHSPPQSSEKSDFTSNLMSLGILYTLANFLGDDKYSVKAIDILLSFAYHSVTACFYIVRSNILKCVRDFTSEKMIHLSCLLSKASLSISYMLKRLFDWESLVFQYLSSHNEEKIKLSLDLIYSFYCHNQQFQEQESLRILLLDLAQGTQEITDHLYRTLTRMMLTTSDSRSFTPFFELAVYKHLEEYRTTIDASGTGVFRFIRFYVQLADTLPIYTGLQSLQFQQFLSEYLEILYQNLPVLVLSMESPPTIESWELSEKPKVQLIETYFALITAVLKKSGLISLENSAIPSYISDTSQWLIQIYANIHSFHETKEKISLELAYRLRPLTSLSTSICKLLSLVGSPPAQLALLTIPFITFYQEKQLRCLLKCLFSPIPEYYLGYTSSSQHLERSCQYVSSSMKLPTFFLSNTENQFLPLPFNWLFLPLYSESPAYLNCISQYLPVGFPTNVNLSINDISVFLMKNRDPSLFRTID